MLTTRDTKLRALKMESNNLLKLVEFSYNQDNLNASYLLPM